MDLIEGIKTRSASSGFMFNTSQMLWEMDLIEGIKTVRKPLEEPLQYLRYEKWTW